MTREEFKIHVGRTIDDVIQEAEKRVSCQLARNYCFNWIGAKAEPVPQEQVVEFITQNTYIDAEHIYPCFDIGVGDILEDGRILLVGYRAGYPPRPWGKNWTGRDGPFVPIMGQKFLDRFPEIQRRELVAIAREILAGREGIIAAAQKLSYLRFSPDTAEDTDLMVFARIANETAGFSRQTNPAEVQAYESRVRAPVFRVCEKIIARFG
jgi:hypothetical protein